MRLTTILAATIALATYTGHSDPLRAQAPGGVTLFEGARLIVGDGRTIENAALVVDGGRIVQAGPAAEVRAPAGAIRVDLRGKTVMPTIIDTHTHPGATPETLRRDLQRRAYFGVGAIMSMGTDGFATLGMRDEVIPGAARFRSVGRGITRPEEGRSKVPYWINTETEGRETVRELAARKVDLVKIWVDDRDGKYEKLTPALQDAIIDEAHKHGLRVTAHIYALEDAKALLRAGVDSLAHGVRDRDIDEEFLALAKTRPNLVVDPNLQSRGVKTDLSWLKGSLPDAEWQKLEAANIDNPKAQAAFAIQARNLAKMNGAGIRLVLGNDGNTAWGAHVEMEDMVLSGMTPMQVIVASTKSAAEFLRLADTGTLEAGKSADFLVLDGNPLEDIKNTRRIAAVYLRGAAVDRSKFP